LQRPIPEQIHNTILGEKRNTRNEPIVCAAPGPSIAPALHPLAGRTASTHNPTMHIVHVITRLIIGGAQENTRPDVRGPPRPRSRVTLISGPTVGPEGSIVERARAGGYRLIEVPELVRAVNRGRLAARVESWPRSSRPAPRRRAHTQQQGGHPRALRGP
jgi:hypothetical protein